MNKEKYVFSQLVSFLDRSKFNRIVAKYDGDKYVKHFTCWNQFLAMMFGQLSNRESLRDLIIALEAFIFFIIRKIKKCDRLSQFCHGVIILY